MNGAQVELKSGGVVLRPCATASETKDPRFGCEGGYWFNVNNLLWAEDSWENYLNTKNTKVGGGGPPGSGLIPTRVDRALGFSA